uniref:SS nuclear autoantigen 1 n=1 Tax=Nothobranchius furzeri TaxID=105023 RepID=A0A8C6KAZ5_NOTFU
MTQQGAALQAYNNELVKCIEELCSKQEELNRQIRQEEDEKERLEHDIRVLSEKLSRVNESLARRLSARTTLDRTIAETEAAYAKVCPGSVYIRALRLCSHRTLIQDVSVVFVLHHT